MATEGGELQAAAAFAMSAMSEDTDPSYVLSEESDDSDSSDDECNIEDGSARLSEEDDSDVESESDEENFDFKEALNDGRTLQVVKVESRRMNRAVRIELVRALMKENILVNGDENRGLPLECVNEVTQGTAHQCHVWEKKAVSGFLKELMRGKQNLTTYCRLSVEARGGEDEEATKDLMKKNRDKGLSRKVKTGRRCKFQIYDGGNRIKVLLLFMNGRVTIDRYDSEGNLRQKIYYHEKFAVENGDAVVDGSGVVILNQYVQALNARDRKKFEARPWDLFLLRGTVQQCCHWARLHNFERTDFTFDQELPIVLGSCPAETLAGQLLTIVKDNDWIKANMSDTPCINAGAILTYALLKFFNIDDKPAYKINTPTTARFEQLKATLTDEGVVDKEKEEECCKTIERLFRNIELIGKKLLVKNGASLNAYEHLANLNRNKQRRFKIIACAVVDNIVVGVYGNGNSSVMVTRCHTFYTTPGHYKNDGAYKYLTMQADEYTCNGTAKSRKKTVKRKRRTTRVHSDAVPPERRDGSQAQTRSERAAKRQQR
jgi:hypothetical protein